MNIDINRLDDLEKLSLITLLWESIQNKEELPVNESHVRTLLDREKKNQDFIEWNEVEKKLNELLK